MPTSSRCGLLWCCPLVGWCEQVWGRQKEVGEHDRRGIWHALDAAMERAGKSMLFKHSFHLKNLARCAFAHTCTHKHTLAHVACCLQTPVHAHTPASSTSHSGGAPCMPTILACTQPTAHERNESTHVPSADCVCARVCAGMCVHMNACMCEFVCTW